MRKILVAPGSGDIHWVMLKMQGIIEKHFEGCTPEVWIWSESRRTERSADYVKRIPFVKFGGYYHADSADVKVGQQVFVHGKPWIMTPYKGFDMFVAFNAPLGWGTPIDRLMPGCGINWDYKIKLTVEDEVYADDFKKRIGPFVPVSFFNHSFYGKWLRAFGVKTLNRLLSNLAEHYTVVLTGCEWDRAFMKTLCRPRYVDLVGETSMGQLLGLLKHARAFVGFAAGNGMLAQHLNCETFMLWYPGQWNDGFMQNWVDPKRLESSVYHPLDLTWEPCVDYILDKLHETSVHSDGS